MDIERPGSAASGPLFAGEDEMIDIGRSHDRWYVVHTQPHAESRAAVHLERQGYRIFCPRYGKTVRHARRRTRTLVPLFPNYLFLKLDISRDRWRSVNGTYGVSRLLMQGERPQPVPHGIVEALEIQSGADGVMEWAPKFAIGQSVHIAEGPLEGLVGTLERLDAGARVRVLLDLLGRSVSVALDLQAVLPAA